METPLEQINRLAASGAATGNPRRTAHAVVAPGAIATLPAWLDAAHPRATTTDLIVADAHTWDAAGARVATVLRDAGRTVQTLVLNPRPADDHLICEDGVIADLAARLAADPTLNPIAVGAGTINDIVKMAANATERPFQCVPTAASMNGYTSAIGAVLSRGVKRTLPSGQAEAVFADVDILRAAPVWLNQAGFGDLLSKPLSHADWLLSHLVRGVDYDSAAATLLDGAYHLLLDAAPGVATGDEAALTLLMEVLLVSGFSMALAGTSAPASGGEHLVSHYWDMEQYCHDRPLVALHGTQVGVATLLSALAWEHLVALDASAFDGAAAAARRPDDAWTQGEGFAAMHSGLTPAVIDEVRTQIQAKQRHGDALAAEIDAMGARWAEARPRLAAALTPASRIARALKEAGCADRGSALNVGSDRLIHTLRVCRHIRSRYVAWDLLDDLGILDKLAETLVATTEEGLL